MVGKPKVGSGETGRVERCNAGLMVGTVVVVQRVVEGEVFVCENAELGRGGTEASENEK